MRLFRTLCISLLLVAAGATVSLAADLSQVVQTLEKGYATLKDLRADFAQRSTLKAMRREDKGGGELFIKKGAGKDAMFRFDYTKPKQQIISNGRKVWYYLPDQKQVMVMDVAQMFRQGNGVALNYLAGMGHVSRDFSVAFAPQPRDRKGNYVLELTPKKRSAAMARIELVVEAKAVEEYLAKGEAAIPFPILASTVIDQAGNSTRIEFSNVKTNRGLSNSLFNFKIPAGVEIVRNR